METTEQLNLNDLNPARRQELITELILRAGSITVDELCERFNVSRMTIHRDLDELEKQTVLRKVRGGATALPSPLFESDIRYRVQAKNREKEAIATYALSIIEPGQAIMLDDSTTTYALAKLLPSIQPLTVITNRLGIVNTLHEVKGIRLISLGGEYLSRYDAYTGIVCEQSIASLRANTLFMSTSAISGLEAFHQEQQILKVKQMMMKVVARRVLLFDHTKIRKIALHRLASLSDFDLVVVDEGVSESYLNELVKMRIPHAVAPMCN